MIRLWDWEYHDVPRLGTVHCSPEALKNLRAEGVSDDEMFEVMAHGTDVRSLRHPNAVGREYMGIRLVIRLWPHIRGAAAVCVNGYRVTP